MPIQTDTVNWDALNHAYGPASDLPALLESFSNARGKKLHEVTEELYSRVLHQGTIYSASPPVAHLAIEMSRTSEGEKKAILYDLLSGFAQAARQAFKDGEAIPCHAGGDPVDGAAIRDAILGATQQFIADLASGDEQIRRYAADLVTAFAEADVSAAQVVRDRYFVEQHASVRIALMDGLVRVRESVRDWPGFIAAALAKEADPDNRFLLRSAQLQANTLVDEAAVSELVTIFVQRRAYAPGDEGFFEVLQSLGLERELAAFQRAVTLVATDDAALTIASHLLRRVFADQRTGWGQTAQSLLREDGSAPPPMDMTGMALRSIGQLILWRLFPFLLKRKIRSANSAPPKGVRKIEYWGLKGDAPMLPEKLSEVQRAGLLALAAQPMMWKFRTNLWSLFGLPETADGLHTFVDHH